MLIEILEPEQVFGLELYEPKEQEVDGYDFFSFEEWQSFNDAMLSENLFNYGGV